MGTLETTVVARAGVRNACAAQAIGMGNDLRFRIGLNRGVDFRVDLVARLETGDPFDDNPKPDEVAEAGIVQAVLEVKREFSFSDGTTIELRSSVGLPARDGDQKDREFATKPAFDSNVAAKFEGFQIAATVGVCDFPSSVVWHKLNKFTGRQSDTAVLERYLQRDAFRSGIMARWQDGTRDYYDWVEWETDIDLFIQRGVNPRAMIAKGNVNVTAHGSGEKSYGTPGIFIAVQEALKPRVGLRLDAPLVLQPGSGCVHSFCSAAFHPR